MIRLAPVDKKLVYGAFCDAFADYAMGPPRMTEEQFFLRMAKNAVDYELSVGAYDADRLVGFTLLGVDEWGGQLSAYDAGTGVVPAFRGQGLAHQMFEHLLPGLRERGVARLVLEVLKENEPALKAYRKAGFKTTRELKSYAATTAALPLAPSSWDLGAITADAFERVAGEMDWLPSFENRVSAVRAIPNDVSLIGAFDGARYVGAYAYSPALRWLLSLIVARSHRRQGVGRALLGHAAATVPAGVTRIAALNVDGADAGMQDFFLRLGFTPYVDQFEMTRAID